jgi:hypothetical protein
MNLSYWAQCHKAIGGIFSQTSLRAEILPPRIWHFQTPVLKRFLLKRLLAKWFWFVRLMNDVCIFLKEGVKTYLMHKHRPVMRHILSPHLKSMVMWSILATSTAGWHSTEHHAPGQQRSERLRIPPRVQALRGTHWGGEASAYFQWVNRSTTSLPESESSKQRWCCCLAAKRHLAITEEIQRLKSKLEKPENVVAPSPNAPKGAISIRGLSLQLKPDFIEYMRGGEGSGECSRSKNTPKIEPDFPFPKKHNVNVVQSQPLRYKIDLNVWNTFLWQFETPTSTAS